MKYRKWMILLPLFSGFQAFALVESQSSDSTIVPVQLYVNMPKLLDVTYSYYTFNEQRFVSRDGNVFKTSLNNSRLLSVNFRYPILKTRQGFRLMMSGRYNYYEMPGGELTTEPATNIYPAPNNTSNAELSLMALQQIKIGTHHLFLTGMFSMSGLQFWSPDQCTGILSASYSLKSTPQTSFALGALLLFPFGYFPHKVLPSIIYSKKLQNKFILDISFPRHIQMHYLLNENCYLKSGSKIVQYGRLRYNDVGSSSKDLDVFEPKFAFFGASEIRLSGMLWISTELGYQYKLSSKVIEHGSKHLDDYLYKSNGSGSFYGNVGLFIRPAFKNVLSANR